MSEEKVTEVRNLLVDAVRSFAEDAEALSDRIYCIIETQFDQPLDEENQDV